MIEEVHFENFKCLSDVRCSLAQWTVFVGPNASGKTSVLEGIYHLSKVARLEKGGDIRKVFRGHKTLENLLGSNGDGHDRLILECESGGDRVSFTASPNAVSRVQLDQTTNGWYFDLSTWDDADVQRDKPTGVNMAQEAIETVAFLDLRASELAKPSYAIDVDPSMASSGEGLASVIASMILTRPDAFIDLLTMLKRIIPQIKNIRVAKKKLTRMECETLSFRGKSIETSIPRSVIGDCLVFDFENAADVAAFNVSAGTLMVLGLLTALHCSSRPRVVLVNDIEKGLHPDAQRELVGLLREVLSKEPELQIIATSHSPYFLDFLQFDEVRLTVLDEKGHTVCGRLENHPKYEKWKMELAPGEMWSLFAEKWMTEGAK